MRTLLATFSCAAALLSAAPPAYQASFFFEPNRGQAPAGVRFLASGGDVTVQVADQSISTSLAGQNVIKMTLSNSLPPARVAGVDRLPGISNYLDRQPNLTAIPHFAAVKLDRIYPGIDLVYKADQSQFEYDFHVAPGADPSLIGLRFSAPPRLDPSGDLLLPTPSGLLRQHRPVAFQTINGQRVDVPVQFRLKDASVSFSLGQYDPTHELIIDPPITYLTYLGSPSSDSFYRLRTDGSGALYVFSNSTITAQTNAIGTATGGITVTKFTPAGQLAYSTRLDSSNSSSQTVDSAGFVYVAGVALTTGTPNVLFKLNQAGTAQVFRTTIPFSNLQIEALTVDSTFNTYLGGRFAALPTTFTATPGAFRTTASGGFLMKYDPTGTTNPYRTFTPNATRFNGLAVDSAGNLYFNTIIPSAWSATLTLGGGSADNTGVAKLNPAGSALLYSLNTSSLPASNLAIDASGNLFLGGAVGTSLPVLNAVQATYGGGVADMGLAKINAAGTALLFATYFGGSGEEGFGSLAVDPSGNAWIGAVTTSTDLPLVGATHSARSGSADGFLAQIKGDGTAVLFSTYVGSTAAERNSGFDAVAADNGAGYFAISTPTGTLPAVNAIQATYGTGSNNLIIGKWGTTIPAGNQTPTVTSAAPAFGTGTSATRTFVFTDSNGAADIGVVNVLINSALDGRNACYLAYDSVGNVLVLLRDNGTDADVLALPSNATLSNSQCSIAGSSITAVKAGNTLTLTLTFNFTAAFNATRILYAAARDAVSANSGWQPVGTQTVALPTTNPQPLGTTPNSGTATVGTTYTITTQYRDATNSLNLQPTQLLINDALTGFNACYLAFVHTTNFLYIVNDSTGDLQPTPIRLNGEAGGAASIENTQCRVISAGSTFSDSGTTLTTTLQIQFKSGFVGRRLLFAGAQTLAGANSGWSVLGSVNVQ